MRKITRILIIISLFLIAALESECAKVYCPDVVLLNNIENYRVFNTNWKESDCDNWKSPALSRAYPGMYSFCLEQNRLLKNDYNKGKCVPIVTKVHNFGSTECKVFLVYKYKLYLGAQCLDQNRKEDINAYDKVEYIYRDFDYLSPGGKQLRRRPR